MNSRLAHAFSALACSAVLLLGSGCKPPTPAAATGRAIRSASELKADALFQERATINYSGTVMAVKLERKVDNDLVKFVLWGAYGQELETEVYKSTSSSFALVGIDEVFDPPIDLLRFPMHVGETWDWKGKLTIGLVTYEASAKIRTSSEPIHLKSTASIETVKSEIALSIEAGSADPALRVLKFWFASGRGIVKRDKSDMIREPATADRAVP